MDPGEQSLDQARNSPCTIQDIPDLSWGTFPAGFSHSHALSGPSQHSHWDTDPKFLLKLKANCWGESPGARTAFPASGKGPGGSSLSFQPFPFSLQIPPKGGAGFRVKVLTL